MRLLINKTLLLHKASHSAILFVYIANFKWFVHGSRKQKNTIKFRVGAFEVEPVRNLLRRDGETFALEPRIMDVLCVFSEQPGEVISREALLDNIWGLEHGGDESLTRAISILRKTFYLGGDTAEYIQTIPKRGYRLAQPVTTCVQDTRSSNAPAHTDPPASPTEQNNSPAATNFPDVVLNRLGISRRWKTTGIGITIILILAVFGLWLRPTIPLNPDQSAEQLVPVHSVAVLPFISMSETKSDQLFADGLTEEILNTLASNKMLKVPARTSSFEFKNKTGNLQEIGKILGVAYLLEGSIRRSGNRIRITAQLINAQSGYHLWSEAFDRELTIQNIFHIQDEISIAVHRQLKLNMDISTHRNVTPTPSSAAYAAYLRGKALYRPSTASSVKASIVELNRAVTLDPEFAEAHAVLAQVYDLATKYTDMPYSETFSLSRTHLKRAIELSPDSPEVLAAKAWLPLESYEGDGQKILEYFDDALAANPNDAELYRGKAIVLAQTGHLSEAKKVLGRAINQNPLHAPLYLNMANFTSHSGDHAGAIQYL
jgi:TolB-like protein/DNA-binding winged helix-turn-helix (wHTH) protein